MIRRTPAKKEPWVASYSKMCQVPGCRRKAACCWVPIHPNRDDTKAIHLCLLHIDLNERKDHPFSVWDVVGLKKPEPKPKALTGKERRKMAKKEAKEEKERNKKPAITKKKSKAKPEEPIQRRTRTKKKTTKKATKKPTRKKVVDDDGEKINISELIRRTGRGKMTKKDLEKVLRKYYEAQGRSKAWVEKRLKRCLWRTKNYED